MHRADALDFEVAAFTNLSRDHLDFHESMERYGEAKARLFTELRPSTPSFTSMTRSEPSSPPASRVPVIRCSRRPGSDAEIAGDRVVGDARRDPRRGPDARGTVELSSPMLGEHNLENLLVALGCAYALGLDLNAVAQAWESAAGSPGRLERIAHPHDVAVLVDYAHTPDALRRVLDTMRAVTPNRLIVVFGAGGDRDKGKRPEMGRVGVQDADLCVLTSDNPRSEDPQRILDEVEAGAKQAGGRARARAAAREPAGLLHAARSQGGDRGRHRAASAGDTVLLAGKGHETYQIIGTERTHFDDREEARAAIAGVEGRGVMATPIPANQAKFRRDRVVSATRGTSGGPAWEMRAAS